MGVANQRPKGVKSQKNWKNNIKIEIGTIKLLKMQIFSQIGQSLKIPLTGGKKGFFGGKQEFSVKKQRRNIFTFIEPRLHAKNMKILWKSPPAKSDKVEIWPPVKMGVANWGPKGVKSPTFWKK